MSMHGLMFMLTDSMASLIEQFIVSKLVTNDLLSRQPKGSSPYSHKPAIQPVQLSITSHTISPKSEKPLFHPRDLGSCTTRAIFCISQCPQDCCISYTSHPPHTENLLIELNVTINFRLPVGTTIMHIS